MKRTYQKPDAVISCISFAEHITAASGPISLTCSFTVSHLNAEGPDDEHNCGNDTYWHEGHWTAPDETHIPG